MVVAVDRVRVLATARSRQWSLAPGMAASRPTMSNTPAIAQFTTTTRTCRRGQSTDRGGGERTRKSSLISAVCASRHADELWRASPTRYLAIVSDSTDITTLYETSTSSTETDRVSTRYSTTIRAPVDFAGRWLYRSTSSPMKFASMNSAKTSSKSILSTKVLSRNRCTYL